MNKNKNVANAEKLITFADFADDVFAGFNNDKERIKSLKLLQANVKNRANIFVISSFVQFFISSSISEETFLNSFDIVSIYSLDKSNSFNSL